MEVLYKMAHGVEYASMFGIIGPILYSATTGDGSSLPIVPISVTVNFASRGWQGFLEL